MIPFLYGERKGVKHREIKKSKPKWKRSLLLYRGLEEVDIFTSG